ncbi:MAG: hypothetical protein WC243_04775 [Patescibacteria group bacterium]
MIFIYCDPENLEEARAGVRIVFPSIDEQTHTATAGSLAMILNLLGSASKEENILWIWGNMQYKALPKEVKTFVNGKEIERKNGREE